MTQLDGSGVAAAAEDLMEEMRRANAATTRLKTQQQSGAGLTFLDALARARAVDETQRISKARPSQQVREIGKARDILLRARSAQGNDAPRSELTTLGNATREKSSHLVAFVQEMIRGQDKMSDVMEFALCGYHLGAVDLIRLQATVYRYSQELELTGKVIDKGTNGIKQTLNTQI